METFHAILLTGVAATIGWIYTARRTWMLSRKQHTISIILQGNFDDGYTLARDTIAPLVRAQKIDFDKLDGTEVEKSLRRVLDHSEFVAAGVRSGDVDEALLKDSEMYAFVTLFEAAEDYIRRVRDARGHAPLYEHFEWIHARWRKSPPNAVQRFSEVVMGRPSHPNAARLKELQGGFKSTSA